MKFLMLAMRLQQGPAPIIQWKSSAAREGARHAFAMLKSHYPDLDLETIVREDPLGADGNPVDPAYFFAEVLP